MVSCQRAVLGSEMPQLLDYSRPFQWLRRNLCKNADFLEAMLHIVSKRVVGSLPRSFSFVSFSLSRASKHFNGFSSACFERNRLYLSQKARLRVYERQLLVRVYIAASLC